jgi:hypothetical protein
MRDVSIPDKSQLSMQGAQTMKVKTNVKAGGGGLLDVDIDIDVDVNLGGKKRC